MPFRLARAPRAPFAAVVRNNSRRTLHSARSAAESLEDRRLLSVTITASQHDVEGDTAAFFADFTSDARPTEAYVGWGDGTIEQLENRLMDYDPATGRGRLYGLHEYAASGGEWGYGVTYSIRRGDEIAAESFTVHPTGDTAPSSGESLGGAEGTSATAFDGGAFAAEASSAGGAPQVTAVFVGGSAWTQPFKTYLANQGLGDATYGFSIPDVDQQNELPWTNLDQVSVRFSEDVLVDLPDLSVTGANFGSYAVAAFGYDEATFTATWTLSQPLAPYDPSNVRADNVLLHLSNLVEDLDGQRLDGEWANGGAGPDAFPSGGEAGGGAFDFQLAVLPGDVNRSGTVNSLDLGEAKARENKSTANPGTTSPYTIFHDVNGSGTITSADATGDTPNDLAWVQRWLNRTRATGTPPPAAFSSAPTGLSASAASDTEINLSWADNSTDETGFLVDVSTDGVTFNEYARVGAGVTGVGVTGALPNTTSYFRVAALGPAGHSAFSSASVLTYPRAPEGLSATEVSTNQIDLEWDQVDGLVNYLVERRDAGGAWQALPALAGTAATYSDTGRTGGTLYEYRLRAVNSTGISAYGSTEGTYTLPPAPSGLTATVVSASQVDLQWSDTSGGGSSFVIEGSTYGGEWRTFAELGLNAPNSYSLTELSGGVAYSFRVLARNDSGESSPSDTVAVTPAAEAIGSWNVVATPSSAALISAGSRGSSSVTPGWLNVVNAPVDYNAAFTGFPMIDDGYANLYQGTVIEMTFPPGVAINGEGADIVLLDGRYSVNSYAVSAGYDGFATEAVPPLSSTGVSRSYWYEQNLQSPFTATIMAGGIDLSALGVPLGQYVTSIRVRTTSNEADLIGVGTLHDRPRVGVSATRLRSQAAEGATGDASGQFTFYRDGDDASKELRVPFTVNTGQGYATPGSDYASIGTEAVFPPGARKVTVDVVASPDTDSNEGPEQVKVVLSQPAGNPTQYALAHLTNATVTILDKKKYLLAYYGAGTGGFGNDWLQRTANDALAQNGYDVLVLRGENDEKGLLTDFFARIDADGKKRISNAEASSAEVRMLGYSFGGVQVINTSRKFTAVNKRFYGYLLGGEIKVQSLVTIDPVNFFQPVKRANGPVKTNVQKYRSYYQRIGGKSNIRKVDAAGNVLPVWDTWGNWFSGMLRGSVMDSLVTDTVRKQVDTDFANDFTERDYEYAFFDGSTGRGRLYGNDVNHDTMPWWCHDRVIADLR